MSSYIYKTFGKETGTEASIGWLRHYITQRLKVLKFTWKVRFFDVAPHFHFENNFLTC